MYLYFDNNGTLLETINDEALRQYNKGVNTINVFIEDRNAPDSGKIPFNIQALSYWFQLADGETINQNYTALRNNPDDFVTKTIPFDRNRDLKKFKYGKNYEFFVIEIPFGKISEASQNDKTTIQFVTEGDVFKRGGLVLMTIQAGSEAQKWLSLERVAFTVEDAVLLPDGPVNSSEFNWLLQQIIFDDVDNYNTLDNRPIINQNLLEGGFVPVAGTYYRHVGGGTKKNLIQVGDVLDKLYFDTTVTPDFSTLDWSTPDETIDSTTSKIELIKFKYNTGSSSGSDSLHVRRYAESRGDTPTTYSYALLLYKNYLVWTNDSRFHDMTPSLYPDPPSLNGGWNLTGYGKISEDGSINALGNTVKSLKYQNLWSPYISKHSFTAYKDGMIYYYNGSEYVAISGSYNDLTDKPSIPDTSKFVTTDGAQEITGNKTISASQTILDTNLIIRHDSAIDSSKNITIASFRQGADILQIENEQVYYDPQGNGFPLNFKGVDPGTDGQVLTSRGANDSPEWADIPKVEVVQATGTSTTSAMSQKATTDELANKANLKGGNGWTGNQQFNQGGYWFATDTNHPFVVELENGKALVTVNQNGVSFDSDGLDSMPFRFNGNAGTIRQVLTSQGPGKTPIWKDALNKYTVTAPSEALVTAIIKNAKGRCSGRLVFEIADANNVVFASPEELIVDVLGFELQKGFLTSDFDDHGYLYYNSGAHTGKANYNNGSSSMTTSDVIYSENGATITYFNDVEITE